MSINANYSGFQAEGIFKQRIAWGTTGNANGKQEYIGYAPPGSSTANACWIIKKFTYDVSGRITEVNFAGGSDEFDKIWDNRTNYSYS